MIEVLVTLVILVFGLLGLAGLQSRAQVAETESYQRTQALVLVRDMADRLSANRAAALADANAYIVPTTAPLGVRLDGGLLHPCHLGREGHLQLGRRAAGCHRVCRRCLQHHHRRELRRRHDRRARLHHEHRREHLLIQVVWQGMAKTGAPPASVTCGQGLYDAADLTRRAVTTVVQLGTLL